MIAGHVYVVHTTLTTPPKDKIVLCICAADNFFIWINTDPRHHGIGQFELASGDHPALRHTCYADLSRATTFQPRDLATARDRGIISQDLAQRLLTYLEANPPRTLAKRYADLLAQMLSDVLA